MNKNSHSSLTLRRTSLFAITAMLAACQPGDQTTEAVQEETSTATTVSYSQDREACSYQEPLRTALFGDLHVHTTFSFDAYAYGVQTTPDDAYRFAKGEAIPHLPLDEDGKMSGTVKIDRPLDFVAVTDHAEYLGEVQLCTRYQYDFSIYAIHDRAPIKSESVENIVDYCEY